jgi:hypothetical protein
MTDNEFRERCDNVDGIVQFNETGLLLQCVAPSNDLEAPTIVYFNELTSQDVQEYTNIVIQAGNDQHSKLAIYFFIVYSSTPFQTWNSYSLYQLANLWNQLELYYILPPEIMPTIPILNRRPSIEPTFYRVPDDVILQQKYLYTLSDAAPNNTSMEVVHFGNLNVTLPNEPLSAFTGTYFYKATGSGVAISMRNKTLVAWNKVHALNILGILPNVIYTESGESFKRNVTEYSNVYNLSLQEALIQVINEMSQGKSIRFIPNDNVFIYFGLGDMGDSLLATTALSQGYTSIQLVREAQFTPLETNILPPVGYEVIILLPPSEASQELDVDLYYPILTYVPTSSL